MGKGKAVWCINILLCLNSVTLVVLEHLLRNFKRYLYYDSLTWKTRYRIFWLSCLIQQGRGSGTQMVLNDWCTVWYLMFPWFYWKNWSRMPRCSLRIFLLPKCYIRVISNWMCIILTQAPTTLSHGPSVCRKYHLCCK